MRHSRPITQFIKQALVSTVAVGLVPHSHTAKSDLPLSLSDEVVFSESIDIPAPQFGAGVSGKPQLRISADPAEWNSHIEREFRNLALAEAKGTLTPAEAHRLEQLSFWRDRLVQPATPEEILLQIKR